MNTNVKKLLFGDGRNRRPPVLLAVTPPRTGERTLLGVENLLQSIAVPEPFSLELAGDADGVNLLARCHDDQVVRSQLSAHYPQARIRQVPVDEDPIFVHAGEQAWGLTLRSGGPEYLPLRTFRDDDLLDPGSDPCWPSSAPSPPCAPASGSWPGCCCAPWAPTGPRPTSRRLSRIQASSGPTLPTPTRPSPCSWTGSPWPCWAWGRSSRCGATCGCRTARF